MSEPQSSWAFVGISPEARQAAELAAEAAGMELDTWLAQLIKYKSAMELKGRDAVSLDDAIMRVSGAELGEAAQPEEKARGEEEREAREEKERAAGAENRAPVDSDPPTMRGVEADRRAWPRSVTAAEEEAAEESLPAETLPEETSPHEPTPDMAEPPAEAPHDAAEEDPDDPHHSALPRKSLPTESLRPSRLSALNQATEEAIQGAFDSWRDNRTLEPLLVRPVEDERNIFEVIVGVERWHAARRAHIRQLPVIVHHATDEEAIRLAMSARLRRGPLSPLTEANIYLSLMSEAGMSTEQVARMVGKPPAHVATMVRVTSLPKAVRDMLERGEITALHARALLEAPNAEALAREVVARRLDIYQTEQLVRTANLRDERSEKVEFSAVDLDLAEGEMEEPPVAHAALDGETGFGPEEMLDAEAPRESRHAETTEAQPFEAEDLLLEEEIAKDDFDLVDSEEPPLMETAEGAIGAPAFADPPLAKGPEPMRSGERSDRTTPDGTSPPRKDQPPKARPTEIRRSDASNKKGVVTTELLEHHLSHLLGLKVAISERDSVGVISLHYTSREELSDIVARLNSGSPR